MRTIAIAAAVLFSAPALAARYVRYDCTSIYYDHGIASSDFHGCSAWYSPTSWSPTDAKREAIDASLQACRQDSVENPCYLRTCFLDRTDLYSPSWACPLE